MNHREILQALLDGETLYKENETSTLLKLEEEDNKLICSTDNGTSWLSTVNDFNIRTDMINKLWKIKPKTININGFEVPEPVRKLEDRQVYHWINVSMGKVQTTNYADFGEDNVRLVNGVVHLTKEAAQIHLDALLSFTKLEDKDE
ncbi:MAG: hypothetical protein WC967_13475 [Balneolaceae bacterium]